MTVCHNVHSAVDARHKLIVAYYVTNDPMDQDWLSIRSYATSACRTCSLKTQCTRKQGGRWITRWVDEPLLEEMEQRVCARPDIME